MDENLVYSWYEQYKNGIFRYILSMTHDPHLSEDVLQDTFVQLLISNVRLAPGHSCRTRLEPDIYRNDLSPDKTRTGNHFTEIHRWFFS